MPTEEESEAAIDAAVAASRQAAAAGTIAEAGVSHSGTGTPAEQIAGAMHHAAGAIETAVAGVPHDAPASIEVIDALQDFSGHGPGDAGQVLYDAQQALANAPPQDAPHEGFLNSAPAAPLEPGWMTTKAEDHPADGSVLADVSKQLNADGALDRVSEAVGHAVQGMPEYQVTGGSAHSNSVVDQIRDEMDNLRRSDAAEETFKLDLAVHDMAAGAPVVNAHADHDGADDSHPYDVIDAAHHEAAHSAVSAADAAPEHHSTDE